MAYGASGTGITGSPPGCRVTNSAAISCANNLDVAVTFDTNRFDPSGMHSTVTNTSRVTIGSPGVYILSFTGEFVTGTDYTGFRCYIRLNGTTPIIVSMTGGTYTGAGSMGAQVSVAGIWKFAANDYVEVLVKQINGAAAARNLSSTTSWSPDLSVMWLGLGT